jgi:hypothetical protein
MKKLFLLIFLFVSASSYAKTKKSNFQKTLVFQLFWNDSISVETYSSDADFCLDYHEKDVLTDGIEIIFGKDYYKIYSPKLKTTFKVKPAKKGISLSEHMIWLITVIRKHEPEEFNFNQINTASIK